MKKITYIDALNEAICEEMARDPNVFIIGEDIDIEGGVWKETKGLKEKFGPARVVGTPISESAFTGIAAGAAMCGLRPIIEFMYMDFSLVALDQLCNQIAKLPLMSGGSVPMPVTVRMCGAGYGTREGAQHSQSLEAFFIHTPGFKVVMPATAQDAKGLMKAAIRDNGPVVFIENRNLYYEKDTIPEDEYLIPIGKADIIQEGTDVSVVSLGYARKKVCDAVKLLPPSISIEIIDLRTADPLDMHTVLASLEKTGKILVVQEAPVKCGAGAEIVRKIIAEGFDYLDCPPIVAGGKNVPVPFSPCLEDSVVLSAEDIAEKITALAEYKI